MNREPIVIGCAIDQAFVKPLAAMVHSILASSPGGRPIHLFVLNNAVNDADKRRLEEAWGHARVTVTWIALDVRPLADLPVWGRMNVITYARLLIGDVLPPSVDRVLWLDGDLIVTRDIDELWSLEIGGGILSAVQDMTVPYAGSDFGIAPYKMLGLPALAPYFNAGVMLIDLAAWRRDTIREQALAYLRTHSHAIALWDQEALNVAVRGRWTAIDPRWNVIASVSGRRFFRPRHLDDDQYQRAGADPWILHFAGTWKPWVLAESNAFRARYFAHLDATPWAGWRPPASARNGLLRAYDAAFRDYLYPLERWCLRGTQRLRSRRRKRRRPEGATPAAHAGTTKGRSMAR